MQGGRGRLEQELAGFQGPIRTGYWCHYQRGLRECPQANQAISRLQPTEIVRVIHEDLRPGRLIPSSIIKILYLHSKYIKCPSTNNPTPNPKSATRRKINAWRMKEKRYRCSRSCMRSIHSNTRFLRPSRNLHHSHRLSRTLFIYTYLRGYAERA